MAFTLLWHPSRVLLLVASALLGGCASEAPNSTPMTRHVSSRPLISAPVPVARPWTVEATPASHANVPVEQVALPQTQRSYPTGAEAGLASFYWQDQMTASGERFDRRALTAAHRTLPLGSRVRVTNMNNGKTVVVRINDRGPFKIGRIIDLSEAAAEVIDMTSAGVVAVAIERVQ